jgi:FixJ family two-component response regulator
MPGLDGIAVAEQLHTQLPDCATLIVTSHGRPGHLKRALAAGVGGFLPKTVSGQVLADVVRTVHAGGRYVDPQLAAEAISTGDNPLTSRETDVLELSANGTPIDPSWPYGVAAAIDICQLGRFYDRFADHAAAVTDRVIYQVTGHPRNADTA